MLLMSHKLVVFHRKVTVLFPRWARLDSAYGTHNIRDAYEQLLTCDTSEPTPVYLELVEHILSCPSKSAPYVEAVYRAALLWKDVSLWLRAVKACDAERAVWALGKDNVDNALKRFGFDPLRPW